MSVDPVGPNPVVTEKSAAPTRKWIAAQLTALAAIAVMYVTSGTWDTEESIALIGWFVAASTSYLVPNEDTPGGVPVKEV